MADASFRQITQFLQTWVPAFMRPVNGCKKWVWYKSGGLVASGPFHGMKYIRQSIGSAIYPKILGTYEKELHETIGFVINSNPDKIAVIGAGEGYYAAGFARLLPNAKIHAYEADETGQVLLQELIQKNQLTNVQSSGSFDFENDMSLLSDCNWVWVDVEGEENQLPKVLATMSKTSWVIEIHSQQYLEDFLTKVTGYYAYRWIPVEERTVNDFLLDLPLFMRSLFHRYWLSLVQEWRQDSLGWLILEPLSRHI